MSQNTVHQIPQIPQTVCCKGRDMLVQREKDPDMSHLESLPGGVGHLSTCLVIVLVPHQYHREVGQGPLDLVDELYDRLELGETLFGGDAEDQNKCVT